MAAPLGFWEDGPSDSKVTAIHACLLYTGKVLIFHCRSYPMWSRLYDPFTNLLSDDNQVIPIWPEVSTERPFIEPSSIFCSGHCCLPNGKVLVAGGEKIRPYPYAYIPPEGQWSRGLDYCFIFDPEEEIWSVPLDGDEKPQHMRDGRWYPTLTVLHTGQVLVMSGLAGDLTTILGPKVNDVPEFYNYLSNDGWSKVSESTDTNMPPDISYSYPHAFVLPLNNSLKGKVFYASTTELESSYGNPQIFDPFATGILPFWTAKNPAETPVLGSAGVLLPIRKGTNAKARILICGGNWTSTKDRVDVIDFTSSINPSWNTIDPMKYARVDHNAVILPDSTLFIVGGLNSEGTVRIPELLDTNDLTWINQNLPEMPVPRRYHSIAILLPNAKILLGGGRVENGGDTEDDTERRLSIFKPGYLMDGPQPVIIDSPDSITYGNTFTITVDGTYLLDLLY